MAMWDMLRDYVSMTMLYSTPTGIAWHFLTCFFRFAMAGLIGPHIWANTDGGFKCDTQLFGCQDACYNSFMPIGMDKFWQVQILCGGKRALEARQHKMEAKSAKSRAMTSYNEPTEDFDDGTCSSASRRTKAAVMRQRREKVKFRLKGKEVVEVVWSRPVRIAFLAHLILRGILEIAFIIIGYVLQANMNNVGIPESDVQHGILAMFSVPFTFRCSIAENEFASRWCSSNKDIICLVSKPTEKKISLYYMNIICLISIALTVCDFVTALYKFMGSKYRKFKTYRDILSRPPPGPDFRTTQCTLPGDMGYTNQNYGADHEVILTRDSLYRTDQGVQAVGDPLAYNQQMRRSTPLDHRSNMATPVHGDSLQRGLVRRTGGNDNGNNSTNDTKCLISETLSCGSIESARQLTKPRLNTEPNIHIEVTPSTPVDSKLIDGR